MKWIELNKPNIREFATFLAIDDNRVNSAANNIYCCLQNFGKEWLFCQGEMVLA